MCQQCWLETLLLSAVPTGLAILTTVPAGESVGYFRLSLRDKRIIYKKVGMRPFITALQAFESAVNVKSTDFGFDVNFSRGTWMPYDYLSDWIQPQHLTPEAIARYSGEMASNPEKLVVIDDFLFDRHIKNFQELMENAGEKETIYAIYGNPGASARVSREKWFSTPEKYRFYTFLEVHGPNPGFELSQAFLTHRLWVRLLKSQQFFDYLYQISGLRVNSVDCVNAKEFGKSHFLRLHDDVRPNRKIEFVVGFSPDWKREYGGQYLFFQNENSVLKQSLEIEYKLNRMMMFVPAKGFLHAASPRSPEAEDFKRWNYTVFFSETGK